MIVVYWLEHVPAVAAGGTAQAEHRVFEAAQLSQALQFAEQLRARRVAGEPISHVAIQSEFVEAVGAAGVSDPPKDYAHYKRRLDPSVPLGRPSGSKS
jgi:hypothetical protein